MKKIFLFMALCLTTVFAAQAGEKQIYARWTYATQTLTLCYDDQMEARDGTTNWWENDVLRAAKIVVLDESMKQARPTSTANWFGGFQNLTTIQHLDYLNTSNVTDMSGMFNICVQLSDIDLRFFNTQKVTNMYCMFAGCESLTSLNVNSFNVSSVTNMSQMFNNCTNLTTIYCNYSWGSTDVESSFMFYGSTKLKGGNGTKYSASHVDASYACPDGAYGDKGYFTWTEEIYGVWDPSTTTLTIYYDKDRRAKGGVKYWWNTSEYTNATKIVFNVSMTQARPTSTAYWFRGMKNVTKIWNMDYLRTSDVRDMYQMFSECKSLESLDLSLLATANVTDMRYMFWGCDALKSITFGNAFNTSNVTSMCCMFADCPALESLTLNFITTRVTDMSSMFNGCKALKSLNLGTYFTAANVTTMAYMFKDCESLTSLNLSKFNTSNVTNMREMFYLCKALESLDLSSFNTENVTNMNAMFSTCSNLKSVNLSSFNTAKVTDMQKMFYGCQSLLSLDLRKFNITKLQKCNDMFMNCRGLTTIYCYDDWSKNSQLTSNSSDMFYNCKKLKGGNNTSYNSSYTNVTYARPDKSGQKGYFTLETKKIYTEYVASTKTLTYYCDGFYNIRTGIIEDYDIAAVRFANYDTEIEKAVIDPSMQDTLLRKAENMFHGEDDYLINLTEITGLENLNTSKTTNMNSMFKGCKKLKSLDLSTFNTENVTLMIDMFAGCIALKSVDLSNFKADNVTATQGMFTNCYSLVTIYCAADFSGVAQADRMFEGCTGLKGGMGTVFNSSYTGATYARADEGTSKPGYFTSPDMPKKVYTAYDGNQTLTYYYDRLYNVHEGTIEEYNPNSYPNMRFSGYKDKIKKVKLDSSMKNNELESGWGMFYGLNQVTEIENLNYLNTSKMTNMYGMFNLCSKLTSIDLSSFNTAKVTDMGNMFNGCAVLTSLDLSRFSTEKVTDMHEMFGGCKALTSLDVSMFDTEKVTDMERMFRECRALQTLDLSQFNTAKVTLMSRMFYFCSALTSLDLSKFNTAKVTNMEEMFAGCIALTTIYCNEDWSTSTVLTYSDNMFNACNALKGDIGTPYNSSYIDVTYAHPDGGTTNPGYFSKKTATGIETVSGERLEASGQKFLRDGQIYILRDGKMYNVMGAEVK